MNENVSYSRLRPLIAIILFLLGIEGGGFQLTLSDIATEFGLNNTVMGSLVTTEAVAIALMPLIFGEISDRIGKKKIMLIFIPVLVIGCLVLVFSYSVMSIFGGIFIVGAGYGIAESIGSAALSDSDVPNAEKNLNFTQAFYCIGAVLGPIIVNLFMQIEINWRIVFILVGIGFSVLYIILLKTPFYKSKESFSTISMCETTAEETKTKRYGAHWLKGLFAILLISILLYCGLENGVAFFADSFFLNELHAPTFSVFVISMFWLAMAISRFIFGIIKTHSAKTTLRLFAISCVLLLALSMTNNSVIALMLFIALGFTFGPIWPMLIGMATKRYSDHSGRTASIMMAGSGIGIATTPLLMGLLADHYGIRWSFGMLSVFALIGCILSISALQKSTL